MPVYGLLRGQPQPERFGRRCLHSRSTGGYFDFHLPQQFGVHPRGELQVFRSARGRRSGLGRSLRYARI